VLWRLLKVLRGRQWLFLIVASLVVVLAAVTGAWTVRHAWAIYQLNRGVGDTVFYDALNRPWFRLDEQRRDVKFEQISPYFKDAVIAIEDHRYYYHPGIDPIGTTRALWHDVRGQSMEGGSTITQQLARTLFLSNAKTPARKLKEAALAVMLEVFLSKKEIVTLYMNRVFMGGGIYGVETMSEKLLHKPASQLSLSEAALIAGMIRNPGGYSPWNHPEAARQREFVVLQRMREEEKITSAQEQQARGQNIHIYEQPSVSSARGGYAKEYLRQQFRDIYGGDNPPDWKVHTSFIPEIQDAAEAAVKDGLRRVGQPHLQAALVALDPKTGNVLAMVGGADFAVTPYNRAVKSRRQPGSAFKPFVYSVALEHGMSPVSTIDGLKQVAIAAPEGVWIPGAEKASSEDTLTLRQALLESNNAAAVLLEQKVGTKPVIRLAGDLGVRDQPDVPSLALGSGTVSPLDLTAAYAVFPSLGYHVSPRSLISVENADGDVVHSVDTARDQVLSPQIAFQMVTMLEDVVSMGTGAGVRAYGVRGPIGGKTGTTNDYHDAWFVGFNSSVVVGVWVGFDQPERIIAGGTGARVALPIWGDFMRRVQQRLPPAPFPVPDGLEARELCRVSYLKPVEGCPTYTEYFKEGDDIPSKLCPIHEGTFKQEAQRAVQGVLSGLGRAIRGIFR